MELPGKLTKKHIEAAINRGDEILIYKHQRIDVAEIWKQLKERKGGGRVRRHNGFSNESQENKNIRKSDTDSGNADSTE
jgi:hypothetical protein